MKCLVVVSIMVFFQSFGKMELLALNLVQSGFVKDFVYLFLLVFECIKGFEDQKKVGICQHMMEMEALS